MAAHLMAGRPDLAALVASIPDAAFAQADRAMGAALIAGLAAALDSRKG